MRSVTMIWFIATVAYEKTMEDGLQKRVKENYCLNAVNFTDCEATILKKMKEYVGGGIDVTAEAVAPFSEVFFTDNDTDDKWFKAKLDFITIDEKTGKEKASKVTYLVQAATIEGARKNIDEMMGGTMIDYVTRAITETNILNVFEAGK